MIKIVIFKAGLGNQMFQYAFSKNFNKNLYYNKDFYLKNNPHNGFELTDIFNINISKKYKLNKLIASILFSEKKIYRGLKRIIKKINLLKVYEIKDNIYLEELLKEKRGIIIYDGYWQTEKYFQKFSEEIRKEFIFPELDFKNKKIAIQLKNEESVSIHIRRGDYIGDRNLGGVITIEYYKEAICYIEKNIKNPVFYIFSDDIEWCRKELILENKKVIFIDHNKGKESYKDMQLMSLCKHNIIPNSSFSWWGAWLNNNPNKIVVAPKRWFSRQSKLQYDDIVPENWIKLNND